MGFFNFGIQKPRSYKHVPIYWDPEKEEREKREREAEGQTSADGEFRTNIKRGSFRHYGERDDLFSRISRNHKEIVKLSFLLFILVLIGVFIYFNGGQMLSLYFD
ncbi:MAG: hypothetical protein J6P49_03065 [Paludibacteraceae bacterium]|nr:hypothetical protein [Paludibacteraceae bacterium]MBP5137291.1 hypothetical protein [Paludibacteraceae bacterium]